MPDSAVGLLNEAIWSPVVGPFALIAYLLLGAGVFFTIRTRFLQLRLFPHMAAVLRRGMAATGSGVSGFQAFATSLASRVGVGNIVGVATALVIGGPGAIFWMWVVAGLGMATSFVESTLAQVYKVREGDGFRGGPAYYLRHGLGMKRAGLAMALLTMASFAFAFGPIQANAIAGAVDQAFGVSAAVSGAILVLVVAAVVLGGVKRISRVAELTVPVMALLYLALGAVVLLLSWNQVPAALGLIVQSAFGWDAAVGGFVGGGLVIALQMGVARGLFSNEAGLGTSPNAAATAQVRHPVAQGLVQSFGVFIDTVVICTTTALIILLSGVYQPGLDPDSANGLTSQAVESMLGPVGALFVTVALVLFAFTSIIAFAIFIQNNLKFIGARPWMLRLAQAAVLFALYLGAVRPLVSVWAVGDLFLGLMALANLLAILALTPVVMRVLGDYEQQRAAGIEEPVFRPEALARPVSGMAPGVWEAAATPPAAAATPPAAAATPVR